MKNDQSVIRAILASLLVAVLSALMMWGCLFDGKALGLNVPISVAVFYASLFTALKGKTDLRACQNWLMLPIIAALSASFAIYNNSLLLFFAFTAIAVLTAAQVSLMTGLWASDPYSFSFSKEICTAIFIRPFHKIGDFYKTAASSLGSRSKRAAGILIGIAVAIPVLVALTLLLMSADSVFDRMVKKIFTDDFVVNILTYLLLFGIFVTLAGSFTISLFRSAAKPKRREPAQKSTISAVPFYILVGLTDVVLIVFSMVQVVFLFGGGSLPEGISYSEYARSGFFQLCAAAAIVFALTALCLSFMKRMASGRLAMKILLSVLAFCIFIMLVSSFYRMCLYEQEYLFTRLRLYVQAFIILLAAVNLFVLAKIWLPKLPLAKLTFYAVSVGLVALIYFNVDGFIGKYNSVSLTPLSYEEYRENFDTEYGYNGPSIYQNAGDYVFCLSVDAMPGYLARIKPENLALRDVDETQLYPEEDGAYSENNIKNNYYHDTNSNKRAIAAHLAGCFRFAEDNSGDFRYWNGSREAVLKLKERYSSLSDTITAALADAPDLDE